MNMAYFLSIVGTLFIFFGCVFSDVPTEDAKQALQTKSTAGMKRLTIIGIIMLVAGLVFHILKLS